MPSFVTKSFIFACRSVSANSKEILVRPVTILQAKEMKSCREQEQPFET
jgi:hypothetical protein